MEKEEDVLEKISYIDIDATVNTDINVESTCLNIKIGSKDFVVFVTDKESDKEHSRFSDLGDCQLGTVDSIIALRKLAKFLELSLDIGFTKDILG